MESRGPKSHPSTTAVRPASRNGDHYGGRRGRRSRFHYCHEWLVDGEIEDNVWWQRRRRHGESCLSSRLYQVLAPLGGVKCELCRRWWRNIPSRIRSIF